MSCMPDDNRSSKNFNGEGLHALRSEEAAKLLLQPLQLIAFCRTSVLRNIQPYWDRNLGIRI